MQSFTLTIFGITSNLAQIKLIPTLYDLVADNELNSEFSIIGVGRTLMDQAQFRAFIGRALRAKNRHHTHAIDPSVESRLLTHLTYLPLDLTNPASFAQLKAVILSSPNSTNRMFYLATFPSLYGAIFANLRSVKLTGQKNGWTRVVIEKPIGHDQSSARALNDLLGQYFVEDQIFRLDHYLGKETLHEILEFRFTYGKLEHLVDHDHLDHIQVTATEDFGIGLRGSYYDQSGALKDVGQNHLLQMIALSTMAKPRESTSAAITAARIDLLKALVPDLDSLVLGQYQDYHKEPHVAAASDTETYFAFRAYIDNDRLAGIPIYVRAGKYLESTHTLIQLVLKNQDVLTYSLGHNRGITLRSPNGHITNFSTPHAGDEHDAYERLILDAISGDQTYFNDAAEVEIQWAFTDTLLSHKRTREPLIYPRGSWGPNEADELIAADGRTWLI